MEIKEFVSILIEKKKVVFLVLFFGIVAGILVDVFSPSYYETNVTFMVLESKMIRRNLEGKKLDIDTYLNFVNNDSVYYSVYKDLDIKKKFDMDFETFKKSFDVTSVEDTAIINLRVIFPDKEMCYKIAEKVAEKVIKVNRDIIAKEIKSGYRFAEEQVKTGEEQFTQARKDLEDFLDSNKVFLNAEEVELARNALAIFSNGYFLPYSNGEIFSLNNPNYFSSNNVSLQKNEAESIFDLDRKILNLKAKIKTAVYDNQKMKLKKELAFCQTLKDEKLKKLEKMKKNMEQLQLTYNKQKFEYLEKYNRFLSAAKAYEKLMSDVMSIKIEIAGKTKEMTVLASPVPPELPVFPRLSITLLAGIFLGVLLDFLYILFLGFYRKLNA